jgi:hypothetical protein
MSISSLEIMIGVRTLPALTLFNRAPSLNMHGYDVQWRNSANARGVSVQQNLSLWDSIFEYALPEEFEN